MKKKLLILSIIPFLLTGCSLFNDIFDGGESYTYTSKSNDESSNNNNPNDDTSTKPNSNSSINNGPHIAFDSEGFEYDESTRNYLITMKRGSSITLNAVIANGDSSEYSLIYSWAMGGEYGTINNNTVRINDDASLTATPYLQISLQKNGTSTAIDIILIRITIIDKYQISVISKSEDVVVVKSNSYNVDYDITVPLANKYYDLPIVKLEDYNEPYTVDFINDDAEYYKDKIAFKFDESGSYFQIVDEFNMMSNYRFHAVIKDNDKNILKDLTLTATETLDSEDVLAVYYGQYNEKINKGSTLTIEKSDNTPITLTSYFNGNLLATYAKAYSVTSEDTTIATIDKKYINGSSLYAVMPLGKVGATKISVSYVFKRSTGETTYTIDFYINVVDNKELTGIYVPSGAKAFSYYNHNLYVNGKIYAIYSVGEPESINGHPNLDIAFEIETRTYGKVTVSFTYKNVTKSETYRIPLEVSEEFVKERLTRNYYNMWSNNGYKIMHNTGDVAILAIPVWFTDSSNFINVDKKDENGLNQKEQIIEDLNATLFGENEDVSWRSVKTFYREESYGKVNIVGKVADWYEVNHASTTYAYQDTAINDLVAAAVKDYFVKNPSETRDDYDKNNDGKIDSVILFYGTNYHCFRDNGQPRSSNWQRKTNLSNESSVSNYSWISFASMYTADGINSSKHYNADDLSSVKGLRADTTIHEIGHAFGLSDYYDKTMTSEPVGILNMQSADAGGHDAYSVMNLGWAEPYVFSRNNESLPNEINITINDFQSSGDMILLTPSWSESLQGFDEYMLLELYTPTGLNAEDSVKYATVPGIRLWHVNAKLGSNGRHLYNNTSNDGNYDLLHLIRNDTNIDYRTLGGITNSQLFKQGESFSMNAYKSQFYNHDGKLDDGRNLGFRFEVTKINEDQYGNANATIKLIKE